MSFVQDEDDEGEEDEGEEEEEAQKVGAMDGW